MKIKTSRKDYVMWTCYKFWPIKNISENYKPISQSEFDYGLSTNLPRIIDACNFSPSLFKLRRGILSLLTKYVP